MKVCTICGVLNSFLILLGFGGGTSSAWKILYNVTLRTNITELIAVVKVDNALFFRYPANNTEKKREDLWKSRVQHVKGHQGDLNSFLHPIMKDFHHTGGSLQLLISCDEDDVNLTRAYMKFISGNSFITFHLKNESWTLSDDQAAVIRRSLDPEYAQNAKDILQKECVYWDEQNSGENHERKDNHTPQNITAIPSGWTSTVNEKTKKQFSSSITEKPDDGGESNGAVIIAFVVLLSVLGPAGIIFCIFCVKMLRQRNKRIPQPDFRLVPVEPCE